MHVSFLWGGVSMIGGGGLTPHTILFEVGSRDRYKP